VTAVNDNRQRPIAGWKQTVELSWNPVSQVEEIAAVDNGAIDSFLAHPLSDTGVSAVALTYRQRRSILSITSHDKPPLGLLLQIRANTL
jgi:predicted P-loop ATPase